MHARRATLDDLATVRELRLAALAESPDAFGSTFANESNFDDAMWRARIGAAGNAHFLAIHSDVGDADPGAADAGGQAVGLAAVVRDELEPDRIGWVVSVWVSPEARRRGAASRLVEACLGFAAAAGFAAVKLHVTEGNDGAESLYSRYGFARTGETLERDRDGVVEHEMERPAPGVEALPE